MLLYSLFILFTLLQLVLHILFSITYHYIFTVHCISAYYFTTVTKFYWIHKGLSVKFVIVCCGVYISIECYENKKQTTSLSLFDLYSQYFKENELCSDLRHNTS